MNVFSEFKRNYVKAKGEITGEAKSVGRLVLGLRYIRQLAGQLTGGVTGKKFKPPKPIAGAYVRMLDGRPMQYWTDGSLRHVGGPKLGKAGRKTLKRRKQAARRAVGGLRRAAQAA